MTKVTCKTCKGTGQMALTQIMEETLQMVAAFPGRTAPELVSQFPGVRVTALNNRLEDLRVLGLLDRKRRGHSWMYFPLGQKPQTCGWDGLRFCTRDDCPQIAKKAPADQCPWRKDSR